MNALIFGYHGQLGAALTSRLPGSTGVDRSACDVTHAQQVETIVGSTSPGIVLNATAYNRVDDAESEFDLAFAVNGVAPGTLASAARSVDASFLHFSTDYVFGDGFTVPIDESRSPAPLSAYGRSKLVGERLALQNNTRTYVIRTTGLYSERRHNFVRTMISHAIRGTRLTVVNDQFVSPTWVEPLADVALEIARTNVYGLYHATSQGACSWYEFAGRIFEILDLPGDLHPTGQEEWDAPARRPNYSALDDAMLRAVGLTRLARWDDMLEAFLAQHGEALVDELSA